jgi:hypothetical protein
MTGESATAPPRSPLPPTALAPPGRGLLTWRMAAQTEASVLAWAGDEDHADALLERLATVIGGLGPAEIARDPLYTVPLAGNARFQRLVHRLEAQMRAAELN